MNTFSLTPNEAASTTVIESHLDAHGWDENGVGPVKLPRRRSIVYGDLSVEM